MAGKAPAPCLGAGQGLVLSGFALGEMRSRNLHPFGAGRHRAGAAMRGDDENRQGKDRANARASCIEPSGIEPSCIEPSGVEPTGIERRGIEPRDIEPGGIEPRGVVRTG
jgi:hypothetical protein